VHNYLRQEGGDAWNGSLFVFDDRLAVPAAHEGGAAASVADDLS
jgi:predicted sulfurtransferase